MCKGLDSGAEPPHMTTFQSTPMPLVSVEVDLRPTSQAVVQGGKVDISEMVIT